MDKEDGVHMYNEILLSHKKEWNNVICSNMDGSRDCHAEWSKSDREGKISYGIPYMWNLTINDIDELIKQKETHWLREWTYNCWWEGWGDGIVRQFQMDIYTLQYLKWIVNKDLLDSTWNSAQCYVVAWMGGEFRWEYIHVYVWLSPFAVHLKLSQNS